MTIVKVTPNKAYDVGAGPLRVHWQTRPADGVAEVTVEPEAIPGLAWLGMRRSGFGQLLVTEVSEKVIVTAVPVSTDRFADGTVVDVQLVNLPPATGEFALRPLDVSGAASARLFTLAPGPSGWTLVAEGAVNVPTGAAAPPPPSSLPPLAQAAVYRAKELAAGQADVQVVVDRSASMLPHAGRRAALVEVCFGAATVLGRRPEMRLLSAGRSVTAEAKVTGASLDSALALLGQLKPTTGFSLAPIVEAVTPGAVTVVVTDGVPADIERATALLGGRRVHLVLIGGDGDLDGVAGSSLTCSSVPADWVPGGPDDDRHVRTTVAGLAGAVAR